jgi:ABC-type Fe3+/spermidine/putrescine transport system ATPase subunit
VSLRTTGKDVDTQLSRVEQREGGAPLVAVSGLRLRFGETQALAGIDLSVGEGEFVTLLGPSGSGKTTLLRVIAGFVQPDEGDVTVAGRSVLADPPERRPVNTVFQHYALFPHLTVAKNIAFGLEVAGVPRGEIEERVRRAIAMVQLEGLAGRPVTQLSGGQEQRVALARALINRPKLLLLDEPLGALDLKLRREMQLELRSLQRELDLTFIYVTHDQEEALVLSDRIAVMRDGRIAQVGTPAEVYRTPASRFVAGFIGDTNLLSGHAEGGIVHLDELPLDIPTSSLEKGPVEVSIRPHDLKLDGTGSVRLQGEVVDAVFLGPDVRYTVRVGGRKELTVLARPSGAALPQTGETVVVSWDPDESAVISSE